LGPVIYTNKKVGVGTSSPQVPLAVIGDEIVFGASGSKFSGGAGNHTSVEAHSTGNVFWSSFADIDGNDWSTFFFAAVPDFGYAGFISTKHGNGSVLPITFNISDGAGFERVRIETNGNVGIGTATPSEKLDVNGRVKATSLELTGGSDLAEPFDFENDADLVPGMVVAIDPANPGKLRLADVAYDKTVAGIVSGAGGIDTGLTMGQQGSVANGRHAVALSGRVYCWADAGAGAIAPGDMLTSSPSRGFAMRAADHEKAFGSIIGKAMTGLEQGKGLVLVLVNLQ